MSRAGRDNLDREGSDLRGEPFVDVSPDQKGVEKIGDDEPLTNIIRLPIPERDSKYLEREERRLAGVGPEAVNPSTVGERASTEDLAQAAGIVIRGRSSKESPAQNPEPREDIDIHDAVKGLKRAFDRVRTQVVGRDELVTQTMYALLTREHQLIFSRAGTAKSLYAGAVFGQFKDAHAFTMQLTKGTTEEGLVGAVDIEELKKGNVVHNVKGSIVDSRLAFLDEIFDANDVALRSLLGILNERSFRKGKQYVEAEMHSAIATSNYVRTTDVTEAVIDRFAFRAVLSPDSTHYDKLRIDDAYGKNLGRVRKPTEAEQIPFDQLDYMADMVEGRIAGRTIEASYSVLYVKNALIQEYLTVLNEQRKKDGKPEVYISPRTIAKTRDCLNASALLDEREEVTLKDIPNLRYMITTIGDEEQDKAFRQAVTNLKQKVSKRDLKAVDKLMETHSLLEAVVDKLERGDAVQPTLWEKVKVAFGITSLDQLTFGKIKATVAAVATRNPDIVDIRTGILARIEDEKERLADRTPPTLLN